MSGFLSGADVSCGPSSVLKGVNGRLDRDVSLQQDRLISTPNVASSSRHAFRTAPSRPAQHAPAQLPQKAFDVTQLVQHLPPALRHIAQPPNEQWASGFRPDTPQASYRSPAAIRQPPQARSTGWAQQFDRDGRAASPLQHQAHQPPQGNLAPHNRAPWARMQQGMQYYPPQPMSYTAQQPMYGRPPSLPMDMGAMDSGTRPYYDPALSNSARHNAELADVLSQLQEGQAELARREALADRETAVEDRQAAAALVDENGVEWSGDFSHTSTNQLDDAARARQTIGEEPIPQVHWQDDTPADLARVLGIPPPIPTLLPVRPGGQTVFNQATQDELFGDQDAILMSDQSRTRSVHFDESTAPSSDVGKLGNGVPSSLEEALHHATSIPGKSSSWEETAFQDDADFDVESFMQFNGEQRVQPDTRIGVGALENWGEMQEEREKLEQAPASERRATYRGMGREDRYLFQSRNPYSQAAAEAEKLADDVKQMGRESPTLKGVLELEAEVQADPTDHEAWYALGLKQQENEREAAAINALAKVVQLDPDYRPAYLALAVSYTNEGSVEAANAMLAKWIQLDDPTSEHPYAESSMGGGEMSDKAKQEHLVNRLVDIARTRYANGEGELDADVQVALGVLFNASEEWDKARDCFEAALEARPDDWLLYNRLGATLANGGKSQDALAYYYRALELHPNFVRALFNLGISHMNLAQYPLAAQRVLDAIRLQQADATEGYAAGTAGKAAKGVTSDALWNSLRNACLHMGRTDLVHLATRRDLSAFPADIAAQGGDLDELR